MQQPTLQNVRVRTTRDALLIFYAVARRVLPMIARRLDAEERRAIVPGNVYIWEERCANSEITGLGMERCQATLDGLNTIDAISGVGDVVVPQGWFRNARASKSKQGEAIRDEDSSIPFQDPWATGESFPGPYRSEFVVQGVAGPQEDQRQWPAAPPRIPAHSYYQGHDDYRSHGQPSQSVSSYPMRAPQLPDAHPDYYRDPSPFTQSSSSSSDVSSPRAFTSTPLTPVVAPLQSGPQASVHRSVASERNLVPLSFLTNLHKPARDPIAEDCLRRLSNTHLPIAHTPEPRWPEMRATPTLR
ncbi:hypothetical protein PHLCEN_2v7362 [Hermanssonia centrifuga]|uniref:Uncharacterized protein n=1 Tax=Hermanssonia centrifuga TaxID=98765 RepID=A0A2R6NWU2_9APHY|nr:hypothetical protein PHLCEN_2v7362 [Hermanssonia centrifuga]